MNIEVTKDIVKILEQSENTHENEYKITTCYFTFDEFTSSFQVKRAIFTVLSTEEMYETDIINNQCDIPSEVLVHEYETVKLGVYGYNIGENEELLNRFSPSYAEFIVPTGSYKEGALSPEPITPSQYDLYSQALQEGLQEVDDKLDEVVETVDSKLEEVDDKLEVVDGKIQDMDDALDDVDTAITETNNLNLDVSDKVDGDVTVTLTKKDASTKSVVISDGTSLMFNWDGTKLGVKTDEDSEYVYVDLQGIQGVPGPQGEPFRIKKTYSSVAEMNADFNNMQYGDYVMIASTVEVEDNAKLYTRGESQWIFITDFSGAQGIKGETGATPNIQIGTVTSGGTPSVTRTGTNENPVLNFVLQPGEKGNKGDTGATGNGIASITKTSTSGLVDTYTITFTSGNTTTFNVTNGNGIDHISLTSQSGATKVYTIYFTDGNTTTFTVQDGEVTQEVFDEEVDRLKMVYNAMPKVSGEGTDITINNTAECPVYDIELSPSELEQATTTGKNLFNKEATPLYTVRCTLAQIENGLNVTRSGTNYGMTIFEIGNISNFVGKTITIQANYNDYFGGTGLINCDENGNNRTTIATLSGDARQLTTTIGNDYTQSKLAFRIYITTEATADTTYPITNIQVEESPTATSYEPYTYGASPNPQYPQEIHTVSGENTITIENKNLLNRENCIEDGILTWANGTPVYGSTYENSLISNYIRVELNQTYSFSHSASMFFYDKNKNYLGALQNDSTTIAKNSGKVATGLTIPNISEIYYMRLSFRASSTSLDYTTTNIMVNKGTTLLDYVPHHEQTYPLSLGDLEYCKIGDYENLFFKNVVGSTYYDSTLESGKWYLKKNIGKVVLDGSESGWGIANTGTSSWYYRVSYTTNTTSEVNGMANYYPVVTISNSNTTQGIGIVSGFFRIRWGTEDTIENFKTWLSTHNIIVYYSVATPTYTPLSDTLQTQLEAIWRANSYKDQTNISQTNADLPFVIKLSAIRDLSGIFELIQ